MITWSYSLLAAFIKCPMQYDAVRVRKLYPFVEGPEMKEGNKQHKLFENGIKFATPMPPGYEHHQPMIDAIRALPGTKHVELPIAVNQKGDPVGYWDKDVWVRGKADVVVDVSPEVVIVGDYKTGKSQYADTSQLKLTAAMLFNTRPQLQTVKSALIFTKENKTVPMVYTRDKQMTYWQDFMPDYARLVRAHETNTFMPKPSGLCKRCPHTSCTYHPGG